MAEGGGWRDRIPDISSLYFSSEEVEPVLCKEHGQEFKHFCKSHMTELYIKCRRMGHKNCETVIDIEEAADNIFTYSHGEKVIQSVKGLMERFKDCKAAAEDLKSKVPNKRKLFVDKVRKARKDIDDYLDEMEDNVVAKIDQNLKEEIYAREEQIDVCNASLSSLSKSASDIDSTMSIGNKEERYIAINRATKQIQQYCKMLLEISKEMSEMNLKFEPNVAFPDIFQSLGTVSVEPSRVMDVFTDTTPIYTGELKLKHVSDKKPLISAIDVLPDGRKLLIDINNGTTQLYDKNNAFVTETVLPLKDGEICRSLFLNSSNEVLVSADNGRLFKVTIYDKLTVSEIKINFRILTVTPYFEDFLCVLDDNGQAQLCVVDKNMKKIIKPILKDDWTLFRAPLFIDSSANKNTIYVLDVFKGCYGIQLDGLVVFHYQNPETKVYGGLVSGSDGLFIGSFDGSGFMVEKLSFSGERVEACTIFCNSYPLKLVGNEMILFQRGGRSKRRISFYCLLK